MIATELRAREYAIGRPIAPVEHGLVRAHALASLGGLVVAALFGLLVAIKFSLPEFLGQHDALSWGRLRMNHTQGVFFGFLGNAALAFAYYASPRLLGLPVASRRLGWFLFFLWNFGIVLPGWSLVSAGILQPLEWAEFPPVVDAAVILAVACARGAVPVADLPPAGRPTVHLELVPRRRIHLHGAGIHDGKRRAPLLPGIAGGGVQRTLDSRRGRAVRVADGARRHLLHHPGRDAASDLQPLPVAPRLLAAFLRVSAQRHAPLSADSPADGRAARRDRRVGVHGSQRRPRGDQSAPVGAGRYARWWRRTSVCGSSSPR